MVNTHLDYVKDGPNRLARGVPVDDVLATEREVRLVVDREAAAVGDGPRSTTGGRCS